MARGKANPAEVLRRTRAEAMRYATQSGQKRLRRLLEDAHRDLTRRLRQARGLKGPGKESFTIAQMEMTLRQIKSVIADLNREMKNVITGEAKSVASNAAGDAIEFMRRAERKYHGIGAVLPIKEARMMDRVAQRTNASVLRRLSMSQQGFEDPRKARKVEKGILERYGENVVGKFEEALRLGVATRKPWAEMRSDIVAESAFLQQAPASWAERIVRTELMAAHNRASWESSREAQTELGDMVKILSATFDNRTGWDSYGVHGQIRRPDEAFQDYAGRLYMHPPNRPNDREVVVPHRISWPIPASLKPLPHSRVVARYFQQRKSGSPGTRPVMSTVPLEQFGKA